MSRLLNDTQLTIVANRLPVRAELNDGVITWIPSPGGLVSALTPALKGAGRPTWVGWADTTGHVPSSAVEDGFVIVPMSLNEVQIEKYYEGFSNATIWPLYHDSIEAPTYHRSWWDTYVEVNQSFADKVAEGSPLPTPTAEEAPVAEAAVETSSPEADASPETTEADAPASEPTENA